MINENIIKDYLNYEKAFDEKENYHEISLNATNINIQNSCFIEVVEMNSIEKRFINLQNSEKKLFRVYLTKIFLNARKYIYFHFFIKKNLLEKFQIFVV